MRPLRFASVVVSTGNKWETVCAILSRASWRRIPLPTDATVSRLTIGPHGKRPACCATPWAELNLNEGGSHQSDVLQRSVRYRRPGTLCIGALPITAKADRGQPDHVLQTRHATD